jgi:predicted metalloprotease with PDZ domain
MPVSKKIPPALHYRIEAVDVHAHIYGVTLTIRQPAALQRVSLPVWIVGSYMVREFSKQLMGIRAQQGKRNISISQLDKSTWQIDCDASQALTLQYQVHAYDNSVRTAWLNTHRGFFNATSLCVQVDGQYSASHVLELQPPKHASDWKVATGLTPVKVDRKGFGTYSAPNYDVLADTPVEMGNFWSGHFKVMGVEHQFVVAGAPPTFDGGRLVNDAQAICETICSFWHGNKRSHIPFERYVFMLNAVGEGYGGLEHHNSTALICQRSDLPRLSDDGALAKSNDGYTTLLGLISHEYFHTWNVKRLRPAEFTHYNYAKENYTELLWFFEGFTSYFDDKLLRRSGLIDDAQYLRLLNKTINQVLQTPGRKVHTVAQSSFEAWTKYYLQDANSPNLTVSYYTKGALVALCLDLSLRQHGVRNHSITLDHVMRDLWKRCKAGPMQEADLLEVLKELTGRSWRNDLHAWVHSTRELPLEKLLTAHGVTIHHDPAQLAQALGLRVVEERGVVIKQVLNGSPAHTAGFAPADEWLGVEVSNSLWRLQKLDDVLLYAGWGKKVTALISRDRQILQMPLTLPKAKEHTTWRLAIGEANKVKAWLN